MIHCPHPHIQWARDVRIMKVIVMFGLFAALLLPPEQANAVAMLSNILWLWRT